MVVFRHLVGTPHRIALFNQIDKLFDEHVLLGTGISSKEMLRQVVFGHNARLSVDFAAIGPWHIAPLLIWSTT